MRSSESVLVAPRTWDDSLVRSSGACRRPATGVLRSLQVSAGCCRPLDADFDRGCHQMACPEAAAAATAAPRPAVEDKIGSRIPGGSGQLCASPSGPISRVNRSPGQESCDPDPGTGRAPANAVAPASAPVPCPARPVCRSVVTPCAGQRSIEDLVIHQRGPIRRRRVDGVLYEPPNGPQPQGAGASTGRRRGTGTLTRVKLVLPASDFASDAAGTPTVVAGSYVVGVGESSADLPIQLPVEVSAQAA